ncbi:MAG: ankyrin repeat domain-containing protein [Candidatus Wallbacteria bacterium]|nr:ankyrin repeat domain-containing protein [Candidatus Wallbacteria bacterium]
MINNPSLLDRLTYWEMTPELHFKYPIPDENSLVISSSEINQEDRYSRTPLMLSIIYGKTDLSLRLLNLGADVNCTDIHGRTALFFAAREKQLAVVRKLLEKGADVKYADHYHNGAYTPLVMAAGDWRIGKELWIRKDAAIPDEIQAYQKSIEASNEFVELVSDLVQAGADVNATGGNGNALFYACYFGHFKTADFLIEHGASIEAADKLYSVNISPIDNLPYCKNYEYTQIWFPPGATLVQIKDYLREKHGRK